MGRHLRPARAGRAVAASWVATALVSAVPAIIAVELTGAVPAWLVVAQLGVTGVLLVAALVWRPLRQLWRFAVVMGFLLILLAVLPLVDLTVPALQAALGGTAFDERMQAEQTAKLGAALLMMGLLLALGIRRRDFFLTLGDLTAPIDPVPLLGFPRAATWRRFGLIWGFGIAGALAVVQYAIMRPTAAEFGALLPMAPAIIVYAALNAFSEELTYRAPMLATLEPAVGSRQALWQSAVLFGVAHYFGVPGGLVGAALSVFMGWILGKAMIETRGLFWAWWIHFLSDVVIFAFLALTLAA